MKFPYGVSDFNKIVTQGYFYVDRTDRLRMVEETGDYLLFLRPRRFGKSLWLSTLENYYDVAKADEFERLFGHLAIGQNPTPLHNRYFILKWDFSMVDSQGNAEQIRGALHRYVNRRIQDFAITYRHVLPIEIPIEPEDALISFLALLAAVRETPYRLYLLVDEYDNFANEVMTASEERYYALLSGEGLLKTVFKAAKSGAGGLGVDRMFITGVSPVVMSDITSGYNVAKNIYLKQALNDLCGFTEAEVADAAGQVVAECDLPDEADKLHPRTGQAMMMMRTFYNGYRFSERANEWIYNPTLAIYFLDYLLEECEYPREMLDSNLAMDRAKIAYISRLPDGGQLILDALNAGTPVSIPRLARRFGVKDLLHRQKESAFNASLLYYFGVLTIGGRSPEGDLLLHIPNMVARRLYAEEIYEMLLPSGSVEEATQVARALYIDGKMQPLCDFIEQRYFKVFDNADKQHPLDYRWANELTVKTAFLTLLFNDILYMMDSEPALERGYADLVMIVRPDMRQYKVLDVLIEFKYVGLADLGSSGAEVREMQIEALRGLPQVQEKLAEARVKLGNYTPKLEEKYGEMLHLRTYTVVALGFERLVWEEVE